MKCAGPVLSALLLLGMLVTTGCANWDKIRKREADAFRRELDERTESALADKEALGLTDCIDIALANNLDVRSADIQARLAKLQRQITFAQFLPKVELSFNYTALNRQPESQMLGLFSVAMQDQRILEKAWQVQMPIFTPELWFLYAMRRRGAQIGKLAAEYTRDMISVQTTLLYYHCLALEESEDALASQLEAAEALRNDMALFCEEGLAPQWQADLAEAVVLARRTALEQTQHAQQLAVADLLTAMGLSPLAGVALKVDTPLEAPEGEVEDLILEALLNHPQLRIADRKVSIQRQAVGLAIATFLPKLAGFANRTYSSNSFMTYPNLTATGLTGVLTAFDGLKNVREYQAARQRKKEAYLEREEASFTIMVSVLRAHLTLQDAQSNLALAGKALEVAEGRLRELEAQWREGLVNAPDRLDALAARDGARMQMTAARFQEQVSIATLLNVMGKTYRAKEEDNENAK